MSGEECLPVRANADAHRDAVLECFMGDFLHVNCTVAGDTINAI